METRVLAAYATKYGATAGIAEKIGQVLREAGFAVFEEFLAQRDRWWLVTFDPTDEPTPARLEADLRWVSLLAAGSIIGGLAAIRLKKQGKPARL